MRRVLPLLTLLAGCVVAEPPPVYELPPPRTAWERERDLRQNLRDGRAWDEQDQLMKDVKGAFGEPSDADSLGPKTKAGPPR
ncbi:MAG TPA: hypothetical protein VKD90_15965 [Gemmataceae bacterium]|nr:hypothetical protein [Gemmataceae bacterium]